MPPRSNTAPGAASPEVTHENYCRAQLPALNYPRRKLVQEEQPSASMFRGFHQLTYLPHYLAPSLFFGWALPTLFRGCFHGFTRAPLSGTLPPPFRGTLSESFAEYVQKEKIFMNSEVTTGYILAAILVAAVITFLLRLLPFGLKKALAGSELLDALSHWIPLGAVALLAIYAVAKINYSSFATAVPYLAGLVVTVGAHLWRKNMVLSMVAGTVTCVVLANWVF